MDENIETKTTETLTWAVAELDPLKMLFEITIEMLSEL